MKQLLHAGITVLAAGVLAMGCNDDATSSNTDSAARSWALTGRVADPALANARVLALNTMGEVRRFEVGGDGRLQVALEPGTWSLSFVKNEQFVATMFFGTDRGGATSSRLRLPALSQALGSTTGSLISRAFALEEEGEENLDLGDITVEDGVATPGNNPNEQLDSDGDGTTNLDDDDADGDGTPDELEDEDDMDSDALGVFMITKVSPAAGNRRINPRAKVSVKFSAPLTAESAALVQLLDDQGNPVPAELKFGDDDDDSEEEADDDDRKQVRLHPTSPLSSGASYVIVIAAEVTDEEGRALGTEIRYTFTVREENREDDNRGNNGRDGGDDADEDEDDAQEPEDESDAGETETDAGEGETESDGGAGDADAGL